MSDLLDGLRTVLTAERRIEGERIELRETNPNSRCAPIPVAYRDRVLALRIEANDHLRVLAGDRSDVHSSFTRLPDFLVFCEPTRKQQKSSDLWVLVCELKSGDAGAKSARRQVQLGRFLAEYLVRLALFAGRTVKAAAPRLDIRGLIVKPGAPGYKGLTGADAGAYEVDVESDMAIYRISDRDDLRIEEVFR